MYVTDHKAARAFAVKWATRNSGGDIANLARAYLRAMDDLKKLKTFETKEDVDARREALEKYEF